MSRPPGSLRRRLIWQLLALAAVLSLVMYLSIRAVARQAAEAGQDAVLGAAVFAIVEDLRGGPDGVEIDLPYDAFSMLGSVSQDRVFYRIDVSGETATGYADLPMPGGAAAAAAPVFETVPFRDTDLRVAALASSVLVDRRAVPVVVALGQTRQGQEVIAARTAARAASLGLGFFALAAALALLTAGSALRPVDRLAAAVRRRGPRDLRPVDHPTPRELRPLVLALDGLITRLRTTLDRTETLIAEAAHHIRTPLATVRARAEIALRQAETPEAREALRRVIRAVEESARSASQILDHATVIHRSERRVDEPVDLSALVGRVATAMAATAELRDVTLAAAPVAPGLVTRGDAVLLESALRNLVDNAVKYSEAEGEVTLTLGATGREAEITITDRGRGLSGADAARLADRFRRGPNVGDVIGSGLGLTIVGEVAAAHGGRFAMEEREGGGTCARLWLPLG